VEAMQTLIGVAILLQGAGQAWRFHSAFVVRWLIMNFSDTLSRSL
jgi:hypothetical protein